MNRDLLLAEIDTSCNAVTYGAGSPGAAGKPDTVTIPTASPGLDGAMNTPRTEYAAVGNLISAEFVAMLLHAAELDYLSGDIATSSARLLWLYSLLSANNPAANAQYAGLLGKIQVLMRQMLLGLDYFGNSANYTTLISPASYEKLVSQLFDYASAIEQQYFAYLKTDSQSTDQITQLKNVIQNSRNNITTQQGQLKDLIDARAPLEKDIADMTAQLSLLWVALNDTQAAFKTAVAGQGNGCDFGQIVAIAACVTTLVSTGGSALTAVGPMMTALKGLGATGADGKPITNDLAGFQYEIKTVVDVGKDAGTFIAAAGNLAKSFKSKPNPGGPAPLPSDDNKILMEVQDFDKQLQPYLDLSEARDYKNLLHTYAALVQSRNNKVMEYNADRTNSARISAQITSLNADINNLSTQVATTTSGRVIGALQFIENSYLQARAALARVLYEMDRSQQFYTLDAPSSFQVADSSVTALKATALALATSYRQALVQFGTGLTSFGPVTIDLAAVLPAGSINRFKSKGTLVFSLPAGVKAFKGYSHVLATQIQVVLVGLRSKTAFHAVFTHLGRSLMIDDSGKQRVFAHTTITTSFQVDVNGQIVNHGDIGGSASGSTDFDYVGVSPYGPWKLSVIDLDQTQLKSITGIHIKFNAKVRTIGD